MSIYPSLYLYPDGSGGHFNPKKIPLTPGVLVKVGREMNDETIPSDGNGFFASRVMSRKHAQVWTGDGKILIKDTKSHHGTYLNGQRLSAEEEESEPFELKTGDIITLAIDVFDEDQRDQVKFPKIVARVVCVLSEEDARNAE